MKNLSHSDLINIDAFKSILRMITNDIEDLKTSKLPIEERNNMLFELSNTRSNVIKNARKSYPDINWVTEIIDAKEPAGMMKFTIHNN